jgi:hypothetical protein
MQRGRAASRRSRSSKQLETTEALLHRRRARRVDLTPKAVDRDRHVGLAETLLALLGMAHNHGTGYKGFRSWAVQSCSTFKPGESLPSRNEKFKFVGHGVVYDKGAPTQTGAYDTVNRLKQTEQRQRDYKIPDRRGVQAGADQRDSARVSKPFIATTTASNSYSNFIEV